MLFRFEDFELDTDAFELRRAGATVRLEPQVLSVLACLVERHDRLVSRDELLDEVWGHRFVSEATVASRIKAARRAVGDDGKGQRLIRTVIGRGFRFVGELDSGGARRFGVRAPSELVGRERELAVLDECFRLAAAAGPVFVLVVGEAGAGKSLLVDAFCDDVAREASVWRGHCLRGASGAEPYWPLLDALSAAGREATVVEQLARYAPGWLVHLPVRLTSELEELVSVRALGTTEGRLVRELAAVLEAVSEQAPLVLVLEDLHWVDDRTLELLEALARSRRGGRLLVVGTFRSSGGADGAPAGGSLVGLDLLRELRVEGFAPAALDAYVRRRCGAAAVPGWLTELVSERTSGNPLFVRCLLDGWLADGRLTVEEGAVTVAEPEALGGTLPEGLVRLLDSQLEELERTERQLVEAASVAGVRFTTLEVAAAVDGELGEVDEQLAALARRGRWLRPEGDARWPDGTRCGAFAFRHELQRDAAYGRLPASRRAAMHAVVGRRLEAAYGDAAERFHAAQLAEHFLAAGDAAPAARWLQAAAAQSLARSAHAEAARRATHALELLDSLPESDDAAQAEIALRSLLGVAQVALQGWGAPELEGSYARARQLCEARGHRELLASVVYGLATLHEYRGEYERSEALLAAQLDAGSDSLVPEAFELLACSTFHQGKFARSLELAEQALAAYDASLTSEHLARYGESPAVNYHCWASLSLFFLGREEESLAQIAAANEAAEAHVYSQTTAQAQAAFLHQFRRDAPEARRWAEIAVEVATAQGFPFRVAQATIVRGWALATEGDPDAGSAELHSGLELYLATGAAMDLPYYLGLAAEAEALRGRPEEALAYLARAREVLPGRGFFYAAPLLRLEALLRAHRDPIEAARLLEQAVAVAQGQGAAQLAAETSFLLERHRAGKAAGLEDLARTTSAGRVPSA